MTDKISYVAAVSVLFAICAYTIRFIRLFKTKVVNCWFCNSNVKVDWKQTNSFVCPSCDQYNGFKEDGDYNCIIPAQLSETYNPLPKGSPGSKDIGDKLPGFENGLCEMCNLYQALKIRALAEFSSETSYKSNELEKFREKLEKLYGLCQQCEATLHQTLGKQNSWLKPKLISWRIQQSKKLFFKATCSKTKWKNLTWMFFRKFLHLISLVVFLLHLVEYVQFIFPELLNKVASDLEMVLEESEAYYPFLYSGGVSINLILVLTQHKIKMQNLLGFTGWIILLTPIAFKETFIPSHLLCCIKFLSAFLNVIFIFWFTKVKDPSTHGTHKKSKIKISQDAPCEESVLDESFISSPTIKKSNLGSSNESLFETSQKLGSNYSSCSSSGFSNENASFGFSVENTSFGISNKNTSFGFSNESASNDLDLGTNLLGLKISSPKKQEVVKGSESFSPQSLFLDNSKLNKGSYNPLQPSKFGKNIVTQSSWVAGGYWGSPGSPQRVKLTHQNVSSLDESRIKPPVFSLSRSSSQSSGFVSQFSDCTSSKTHFPLNTFHNTSRPASLTEVDRASLLSEPSFHTWSNTPNTVKRRTFDAQSACSASSFLSEASQVQYRPPSKASSFICDNYLPNLNNSLLHCDKLCEGTTTTSTTINSKNSLASYLNLGVAFFLGLSVSANIFLLIILYQFDLFSLKS